MAIKKKYQALGRGLDALISTEEVKTGGSSSISEVRIELIHPNPNQPRREFDDDSLQELANSIRQIGIIQPITLRDTGDGSYTIIAGERRWKASQRAGLEKIPAYIRTVDDENMMEMALVENIQREDLNALEIALAYQHLTEQYGLTQEKLSERVGKNRATVTNYLRLLKLPATIQVALKNKDIDMGHARALLSIEKPSLQLKLYNEILKKGLSVRQVEQLAKQYQLASQQGDAAQASSTRRDTTDYAIMQRHLANAFGVPVKFACDQSGKGRITFSFKNEAELEKIIGIFDKLKA